MKKIDNEPLIQTTRIQKCCLCGCEGSKVYNALEDRLYGAPDVWTLKKCRNSKCGLIWLDPMPLVIELPKLYQNYYTHEAPANVPSKLSDLYFKTVAAYLRRHFGYPRLNCGSWIKCFFTYLFSLFIYLHPERRASIDCSIMSLSYQSDSSLLEVGFGDGSRLQSLEFLGWSVEGVDFDPTAVKNAQSKGLKVFQGDIFSQKYDADSFDVVISSHVIEHVPDPMAFLKECHRILKKGGKMVHYTPNSDSYGHQKYKKHWRGLEPPRHLHLFSWASLEQAALDAGFNSVQCNTSSRGANMLLDSALLKQYGTLNVTKSTLSKRFLFEYFAVKSFVMRQFNAKLGEELVVVAIK